MPKSGNASISNIIFDGEHAPKLRYGFRTEVIAALLGNFFHLKCAEKVAKLPPVASGTEWNFSLDIRSIFSRVPGSTPRKTVILCSSIMIKEK